MTSRVGVRKVGKERRHRGCRGPRPRTAACGGGDGRLRDRKQWYSRYLRARQVRLLGEPLRIRRRFLCTSVRGRISAVARPGLGFEAFAARRAGDQTARKNPAGGTGTIPAHFVTCPDPAACGKGCTACRDTFSGMRQPDWARGLGSERSRADLAETPQKARLDAGSAVQGHAVNVCVNPVLQPA